jgi:CheY-like chemotaxis protein
MVDSLNRAGRDHAVLDEGDESMDNGSAALAGQHILTADLDVARMWRAGDGAGPGMLMVSLVNRRSCFSLWSPEDRLIDGRFLLLWGGDPWQSPAHGASPEAFVIDRGDGAHGGFSLARSIKRRSPATKVILAGDGRHDALWSAVQAGADGYLLKHPTGPALIDALEAVA